MSMWANDINEMMRSEKVSTCESLKCEIEELDCDLYNVEDELQRMVEEQREYLCKIVTSDDLTKQLLDISIYDVAIRILINVSDQLLTKRQELFERIRHIELQ